MSCCILNKTALAGYLLLRSLLGNGIFLYEIQIETYTKIYTPFLIGLN